MLCVQGALHAAGRGESFDIQGFINHAVEAGQKKIVIPAGSYRVAPQSREHLVLSGLRDTEIDATGVEMICTETTRALTISGCSNLTLTGLTIDYDPLPFTQGRITAVADDRSFVDFEIIDGYSDENLELRVEIFDPQTAELRCPTDFSWRSFERLSHGSWRVRRASPPRPGDERAGEQMGDILVTNSIYAPNGSIPHAIYLDNSSNVELRDVSLYASNCFGFFETCCDGTIYRRCRVDRRPLDDDIKPRALMRMRSLDADAFHSKYAVKGPALLQCRAHYQGDDCINICGDYQIVLAAEGARLRVLAKHGMNIRPEDPLEIFTYAGERIHGASAVSVQRIGALTDNEKAFLSQQNMNEYIKGGASGEVYEVVIDRAVELPVGSVIAAEGRIGSGFRIVGCDFGHNRSRGILVKASDGIISGNRLTGCMEEAIKVSPEYWWMEAGCSDNLLIENNEIKACSGKGLAVYAHGGTGIPAPAGAHNNIRITGNSVKETRGADIWITSTRGLELSGNSCAEAVLENCDEVRSDMPVKANNVTNLH
jgi:hypothetical protein